MQHAINMQDEVRKLRRLAAAGNQMQLAEATLLLSASLVLQSFSLVLQRPCPPLPVFLLRFGPANFPPTAPPLHHRRGRQTVHT